MKKSFLLLGFILLLSLNVFSQKITNNQLSYGHPTFAPLNPDYLKYLQEINSGTRDFVTNDGHLLGEIPSPDKMDFTSYVSTKSLITDPAYDLRTAGPGGTSYLTSVKNQDTCGACWTFATMGSIESRWKILGYADTNLSEDHLNNCHGFLYPACTGGNMKMSAAYLSRKSGPMSEADDPYADSANACPSGLFEKGYVYDICWLPNDMNTIKQALIDYGALYTNMYYHDNYYNSTNKTYYYNGGNSTNHSVLLVGWDNNKVTTGGTGAWIIRNSWGTGWGENGFFYISYNDARVNSEIGYFPSRLAYNPNASVYEYDDLGSTSTIGYSNNIAYGLVKYTATNNQYLIKIGTWLKASNAVVDIYVYDDFNSGTLSNLLGSVTGQTRTLPGYYTFDLPASINLSAGNDFYIKIKYNTPSYNYPIPVETVVGGYTNPPIETGKCWISNNGTNWQLVGGGTGNLFDVCIKAYDTVCNVPAAAGTITGTATVCQGQNGVSYSVPVIANATSYTWSYSGTGATISGPTNPMTINFSGTATAGNLTVRGTNSCTSGPVSPNYAIAVNPLPGAAGAITGTATVCQGQNGVSYSVANISNVTSYTWTYSGTGATISGATNPMTINFSGTATSGTLTVKGTNSCGNGTVSANYAITVNSLPGAAGVITGTATVCQGQNGVSYSVPNIANTTSYTWAYTGTGTTISGATNPMTINFSGTATSGTLTVKGTNPCGNGTVSANYSITVNSLPGAAGAITGTATVCQGQNGVSYSVPNIANATSYTWAYSGTGATISGATNPMTINFSGTATSGNLTVKGTNSCGNGTVSANYAITVNPLPGAAATITGTASVCQGQNGVSYSVPNIANATSYTWAYSGTGATISGATNPMTINFSGTATSGILTVMGTNTCGNGTVSANYAITVNPLPGAAGTITGTATVCQGQNGVSYSVPNITSATSYTWSYTGTGATISGATNPMTINFSGTATSGNLTVKGTNSCGNGTISANYAITVNPLPGAAGAITGTATVCQGQNGVSYSVPNITNATSYTWSYTGTGATISGATNPMTINFSPTATSGNLTVAGTNSCGNGTVSANYAITVNPLPGAAGTIAGTATVCQGQNGVSYSVTNITNATSYTWAYSGTGATISGATNPMTINFSGTATSGNLTVTGINSCGNGTVSAIYAIVVTSLPGGAGNITGTSTVCQGQNGVSYSVPNITNATSYIWAYTGTGATISGATNPMTINFSPTATPGNLTVTGTNVCGNGTVSANYAITINQLPNAAGSITGTGTVCQGQNGVSYSVPNITNTTSYTWSYTGTGATISGSTNPITINFSPTATSGNLTVAGTNSCGNGTVSANYAITVNPLPAIAGTITGTASVCQGQNGVSYSVSNITNATSYTWSYTGTGATISGSSNPMTIDFSPTATSGNLTVTGTNSCGSGTASANYAITLYPLPDAAGTISGTASVCQGQNNVTYSVAPIANTVMYVWTLPTGACGSSITNNITVSYGTSAVSGNITVKGNNSCGDGVVSTLPIIVNLTYSFNENQSICSGTTYNWHGTNYSSPGTYTASYSSIHSCDSIYYLQLTVNSVNVNFTVADITLTADASPANYQWLDCSNSFATIPGATLQSFTPVANGNYAVLVTQGICSDTSACYQINTVGIASSDLQDKVFFPNPCNGSFTLTLNEDAQVKIFNDLGCLIYKSSLDQGKHNLSLDMAGGVYFLQVSNEKTVSGYKMVVKKW